jgi:hypothetical protein
MKKRVPVAFLFLVLANLNVIAQEPGPGIGIYPTGTETGFGYRSAKDTRWALDVRITRANLFTESKKGSFVNEVSAIYRIVRYEKVRFHVGLGGRADWNFEANQSHRFGIVTPIGIEAFPFPFQNAGLFFEAAPFFTAARENNNNIGVRTVAGFVFYFIKKKSSEKI